MSAVADPIESSNLTTNLNNLNDNLRSTDSGIIPPVPESLEELGIPPAIIEQLVLKFLYFRGELLGRDIGGLLGLSFSLIEDIMEALKRQHYVGVKKSLGMGNMSGVFALT